MKPIKNCLNKQLAELCKRSVVLEELTQKVHESLPAELSPYCRVSSFNKGCLVLVLSDVVWASPIRYILPELRDKLRTIGLYQLTSIKITVAPEEPEHKKPPAKSYTLTANVKETILNESQTCTYEPLKAALIRLAQRDH